MPDAPATWRDALLGFIYPESCQICREARATPAQGYVCAQCWQGVRFIKPPFCERCGLPFPGEITAAFECSNCHGEELAFSHARSAVAARGVVLDAIHHYKYSRALWFEPFLADLLLRAALPELKSGSFDAVVPIPLHPVKQREREFNQAARIGQHLAEALGISLREDCVRRVRPTITQTRLSRAERADNVRRAFAPVPGARLHGERVILLDDVFTTGATTSACARILRDIGAGEVVVWTIARGLAAPKLSFELGADS
jgi:ComF family protein